MIYNFSYNKDGVLKTFQVEAIETGFEINYTELSMWGAVNDKTYNAFRTLDGGQTGTQYYHQYMTHFGDPYTRFAYLPSRINTGLSEFLDWTDTRYQLVMSDKMDFIGGDTLLNNSYKKLHCGKGHVLLNFAMRTEYEQGQPVTKFVNSGFARFNPESYDSDAGLIARSEATNVYTYDSRYRSPNLYFMRCILNVNTTGTPYDGQKLPIVAILRSRYSVGSDYPSYSEIVFVDERLLDGQGATPITPGADPKKNSVPNGWKGNRSTASSADTPGVAPAALKNSVNFGDHGIFLYKIDMTNLKHLSNCLWSKNFVDVFERSKFSPATCILSLHKLPYTPQVSSNTLVDVKAGGMDLRIQELSTPYVAHGGVAWTSYTEVNVQAYYIYAGQEQQSNEVSIEPFFNSFLDFEPYTQVHIRIPFVGMVQVPTSSVMGGRLKLNYIFDNRNGNFVCQVLATSMRNMQYSDANGWVIIAQYTGCCSMPMAITGNTQGGMATMGAITGFASSAVSGAVQIAAGDVAKGGANIAAGAIGALGDVMMAPHQTQLVGTVNAEAAVLEDLTVRVLITRPVDVTPGSYEVMNGETVYVGDTLMKQKGLASYSGAKVKDYDGMTAGYILGSIDGATAEEMTAIRNAFLGGVIV